MATQQDKADSLNREMVGSLSGDESRLKSLDDPAISLWPRKWPRVWKEKGGGKVVRVYDVDWHLDAVFFLNIHAPDETDWMYYDQFTSDYKPLEDE